MDGRDCKCGGVVESLERELTHCLRAKNRMRRWMGTELHLCILRLEKEIRDEISRLRILRYARKRIEL